MRVRPHHLLQHALTRSSALSVSRRRGPRGKYVASWAMGTISAQVYQPSSDRIALCSAAGQARV